MIARVSRTFGLAVVGAAMTALGSARLVAQDLNGAGASFPQPIYSKWFTEYEAKTGVKINYQPIGSGGGVKQFTEGTVDFGASDAPLYDAEIAKLKSPAFHIPTVLGAVVMTYNLPDVTKPLNMTGSLIADIYLGKVTKWNDPAIAALNKDVKLPNKDILVVHRSDGSGTTFIFTDYLSKVSPEWKQKAGNRISVRGICISNKNFRIRRERYISCSRNRSDGRNDKFPFFVLNFRVVHLILKRVNQFNISDRSWDLFYLSRNALIPFGADASRPFH